MIKREVDISEAKELGYAKDEPNQKTIVLYEYELEDIPKLLSGELTHFNGTQMNGDTGKTEWFRFTPEALEAWDKSKAADELMYWAEIEKKLNAKKNSFQNTLSKSIDPAELIADSIRKHQWRLTPSKDKNAPIELGLDPNGHLKAAYSRLMQGEREYRTGYWYYHQILADVEVKFLQWLKEKQDSTRTESTQSVRGNGIAPNELSPSEMILRHAEFDLRVERLKRERAELKAKPVADTSTAPQESKGGTKVENEPLTETRETVASILDPFNDQFIGKDAFEDAIDRVCRYFDGEPQIRTTPIKVRNRRWKKLGKALGDIHRDIRNLESIGSEYQQFVKVTFDCFAHHDISSEKNTLRTYLINS